MGTKTILPPKYNKIFGPKKARFCPKYAFLVILGQILAFLAHLMPCPNKKTTQTRCLGIFWYMGTKTFATFPKNKDFKPKKDQFGPKLHFSPYNVFNFRFGALLDQKSMQARCLGSFLICGYQNFAPSEIYKDIMSSLQKLLSFRYQKTKPNGQ